MGLDASNARFRGTVLFPIITFGASRKFRGEGWGVGGGAIGGALSGRAWLKRRKGSARSNRVGSARVFLIGNFSLCVWPAAAAAVLWLDQLLT